MRKREFEQMSVREIMSRWPQTVGLFVARRLHCIGCPISDFHRLADAAREHGCDQDELIGAVKAAVDTSITLASPARFRRR